MSKSCVNRFSTHLRTFVFNLVLRSAPLFPSVSHALTVSRFLVNIRNLELELLFTSLVFFCFFLR